MNAKPLLAATIVAMISAVTAGLLALGSPAKARERRFDSKRVENLAELSSSIDLHRSIHGRLPTSLGELEESSAHERSSRDPNTLQPYEFRVIGGDTYELCATFHQAFRNDHGTWRHGAGRQCFTRRAVSDRR